MITVARELDASGLNCPMPIIRTRKVIQEIAEGQVLKVIATDAAASKDIAAFCSQTGNELIEETTVDGRYEFLIRKGR